MIRDPDAHSVISYASRQRCHGAQDDNGGVADIVSLRLVEVANRRQVRDPPVQLREEMNQRYRNTLSTSFRKSVTRLKINNRLVYRNRHLERNADSHWPIWAY